MKMPIEVGGNDNSDRQKLGSAIEVAFRNPVFSKYVQQSTFILADSDSEANLALCLSASCHQFTLVRSIPNGICTFEMVSEDVMKRREE